MNIKGTVADIEAITLKGTITDGKGIDLKGTLNSKSTVDGSVSIGAVIEKKVESYDGPYEIVPAIEPQTVFTKEKFMNADLKIEAIPYAEVTNLANGITVTIGGN